MIKKVETLKDYTEFVDYFYSEGDFIDGIVHQERYYDKDGNPHLDIDYSDHGNPKKHPVVPHEHNWTRLG